MAGGLATRMRPATDAVPKAMLEAGGKPFLQHQIELLKRCGILDIVLCVGYLSDRIRDRFQDGSQFGVSIRYSDEGKSLMGTAGALKKAEALLAERFFVLDGDAYLPLDYRAVMGCFEAGKKRALMVVYENRGRYDHSNVLLDGEFVKLYDRSRRDPSMAYIHAGLSVLSRAVLSLIPADRPSAQDELWRNLISSRDLLAYRTDERFYEIGSASGLDEFRRLVEQGRMS